MMNFSNLTNSSHMNPDMNDTDPDMNNTDPDIPLDFCIRYFKEHPEEQFCLHAPTLEIVIKTIGN